MNASMNIIAIWAALFVSRVFLHPPVLQGLLGTSFDSCGHLAYGRLAFWVSLLHFLFVQCICLPFLWKSVLSAPV